MKDFFTKKQHYIPRTYLRQFSKINCSSDDKKNKIFVFDKSLKKKHMIQMFII